MVKEDRSGWVAVQPDNDSSASTSLSGSFVAPAVSAYTFFQREQTSIIKNELNRLSGTPTDVGSLTRAVSQKWQGLTPYERDEYDDKARCDKMRFLQESHLRDIAQTERQERLRRERDEIPTDGKRKRRHANGSVTNARPSRSRRPPAKRKVVKKKKKKRRRYNNTSDSDESESDDDSDFMSHEDKGSVGSLDEKSLPSDDDSSTSSSSSEESIKVRAKPVVSTARLKQRAEAAVEKELKESYILDRQSRLRKERGEQAKRRLEFLLSQSEIFSHFGVVKADKAKFVPRVKADTDEPDEGGAEVAGSGENPCIHREGVDAKKGDADEVMDELLTNNADDDANTSTYLTTQPSTLNGGVMRPYQLEGLNWMIRLQENGVNGILADEMGLGKTLQSISTLVYMKEFQNDTGPHLVVVPKSTLSNWMNELRKWSPSLRALRFHGNKDEREHLSKTAMIPAANDDDARTWDVCVTTYEVCNSDKHILNKFAWAYLIIDEAHRLKNEASTFSKTVRTFETKYRLLLTGTPLQNNLHELWALLNFLVPDVFANAEQFDEWFNLDIEDAEKKNKLISQLHKILRPFMLRRLKADVEKSLPPKHETILFVGMSALQKRVYKDLLMRNLDLVQGGSGNSTAILNIVMQLRKCAGHPYLFPGVEDRTLPPLGEHFIQNCGKMVLLDKLLKKLHQNGHRVLLFTQMTKILDILEDFLVLRKYQYCRIDGNTSYDVREESIDAFNAPQSEKFLFLLSTRAGGLGINLQTADVVILYDSDWNPQADLQAQDRAHRIGQKREVQVFRFVTENSIEEKVVERAQQKLKLDAMVVQQGRLNNKDKLSRDSLLDAVRFGADKVFKSKDSSITDDDIDMILNIGKKKTLEMNEKLQKAEKGDLLDFKFDGAGQVQTFEGVDYSEHQNRTSEDASDMFIVNLGKRERKQVSNYNEGPPPRKERKKETRLPKYLRLPRLDEWQMFDTTALYLLQDLEETTFKALPMELQKYTPGTPDGGGTSPDGEVNGEAIEETPPAVEAMPPLLNPEQQLVKKRLLSEGFADWGKHHYSAFVKASATFGRNEHAKIAEYVGKPEHFIRDYAAAFWDAEIGKRRISEHEYDRVLKIIERGEKKLDDIKSLQRAVRTMVGLFHNPWLELEFTHVNCRDKAYTKSEDRNLLCWAHKYGYGQWDAVRMAIRRSHAFRFDYYLRSLPTEALGKRCEQLMRAAEKEVEQLEKLARGGDGEGAVSETDEHPRPVPVPVRLPTSREMKAEQRLKAETELDGERAELQHKVEDIENEMEAIQKRLRELDDYSKEGNFSKHDANADISNDQLAELVNVVARSGPTGILVIASEFVSKHHHKFTKRLISTKIDEVAKKEKREEEGDTRLVWHILPEYHHLLDVETLRFLRLEKEKRHEQDDRKKGNRNSSSSQLKRRDSNGEKSDDGTDVPRSFPAYDAHEAPKESRKAFTHFCIHTRRKVKHSLGPEHRKDKSRINSILKDKWYAMPAAEKTIWQKWEAWDAERFAHERKLYTRSEGKVTKPDPSYGRERSPVTSIPKKKR